MRLNIYLSVIALAFVVFAVLLQCSVVVGAQNASIQTPQNLSSLYIARSNASIYLNSSLSVPFSVTMLSGVPGNTSIIIANGDALQANGVYVGVNPGSGIPGFNGTIYINTNVKPGVVPGVYVLQIESVGADPIYPNIFNFTLTVHNAVSTTTTEVPTTSVTSSIASASTTIEQKQKNQSLLGFGTTVLIIILAIILVVFLAIRAKHSKQE